MNEEIPANRSLDLDHELSSSSSSDDSLSGDSNASGHETRTDSQVPTVRPELPNVETEPPQLLDRLARMQADFENARKRALKEQQEFQEYAVFDAVKTLLPVLDSFERALRASSNQYTDFQNGMELIYRQLLDAMVKLGVHPIHAQGERFDPHIHQAVDMVETDEAEDQRVLEELQRGYKFKDRLLRPSMVRVARNSRQ
jgi:molecular chaperone GrpE